MRTTSILTATRSFLLLWSWISFASAAEVQVLDPATGAASGRPFSDGVLVDDMIYLSGALGMDPATGRLVEGGVGPETRQALTNIRAMLTQYGSSMESVVKCTVMLADIEDYAAMNAVYVTFFPGPKPARSTFAASGLALGARTEIECWAVVE